MLFVVLLVALLTADPPPEQRPEPQLRQTGVARGFTDDVPRSGLCERAGNAAWDLVWRSCNQEHRVENVIEGGCATVDYRPARDDGRGPFMEVRVQVEYDCRPE